MAEDDAAGDENGGVVRERLLWQTATRDDRRVAQALHAGEEVDALHELRVGAHPLCGQSGWGSIIAASWT